MKKILTTLLLAGSAVLALHAQIGIQKNGLLKVDGNASFQVLHYSDKWFPNRQRDNEFKREDRGGTVAFSGNWLLRGSSKTIKFNQKISPENKNAATVVYSLNAVEPIKTATAALQIELPVWNNAGKKIELNGKEFELPQNYGIGTLATVNDISSIRLPLDTGTLTVSLKVPVSVRLMDVRQFKQDIFVLRLAIPGSNPVLKQGGLECKLSFEPYRFEPLNLNSAMNMGFIDEIADDRKGGWTDQGPSNDMRILKAGKINASPFFFTIQDAKKNNGNSCIVLGGGGRQYFPKSATIAMNGKTVRTLFLLHAIAWPPKGKTVIGTIEAEFTDGSRSVKNVTAGQDVDNWWMPTAKENGAVAWSEFNGESPVGLYRSGFELPGKPLKNITFRSNGKSVWIITSATASPQRIVLRNNREEKLIMMRGADWRPLETDRTVVKDSALDFSFLLDAPAGKYGCIKVANGHFEFEKMPGKAQRFYGANIAFWANYLTETEADLIAERLGRIGYNAVRLHHFDRDLVLKNTTNSCTLDPAQLKKLDYLVYCLKKRGIYVTLDLFTARQIKKNEFKTFPGAELDYKLAAMISPEVMDNLKSFTKQLMTHVNPYTGIAWKDDPVFIGMSLINENTILHIINNAPPEIKKVYDTKFKEWSTKQNLQITEKNRAPEYRRFLLDVYGNAWKDLSGFVRGLGVRMPLTDQNYIAMPETSFQRAQYDYTDNHVYWDHPQFLGKSWSLPMKVNNCSTLAVRLRVPKVIAASRVFGKPFTVTEFDFCYPNNFRAEGAPIFAAYAAMQDWDAIYRFAYSHSASNMLGDKPLIPAFDVVNDPPRLLSERIGAVFFVRGDISQSKQNFAVRIPEKSWQNPFLGEYPMWFCDLMFFGKVGSVVPGKNGSYPALSNTTFFPLNEQTSAEKFLKKLLAEKVLSPKEADLGKDICRSSTGELTADFKNQIFSALNKRSEALVIPGGATVSGNFLTVKTDRNFCVASAVAIDSASLADSRRVLLLHLTDVKVEQAEFTSKEMKILLKEGDGQLLARKGNADFTLSLGSLAPQKLYALDCSGRRLKEIPFTYKDGKMSFKADTFCAQKIVFAYELLR